MFAAPAKTKLRSKRGSLTSIFFLVVILTAAVVGSLAIDFFHMHSVQTELQSATDAAALAGAQDLYLHPDRIESHALATAALNYADGRKVSSSEQNTKVTVKITQPYVSGSTGQVQVTATMLVNHVLAPIVGHSTDNVTATSVAGRVYTLKRVYANQMFPLAVSWDERGPDGVRLMDHQAGDQVQFVLGSQQYKNAGWTSLDPNNHPSASMVKDFIDVALGLGAKKDGVFIPPVTIGQNIGLTNGEVDPGIAKANSDEYKALIGTEITMPVISGEPAYNGFRPCIGFIGLRVTSIEKKGTSGPGQNLTFTGVLIKSTVLGDDVPSAPDPASGLENFTVGPVKLVQ